MGITVGSISIGNVSKEYIQTIVPDSSLGIRSILTPFGGTTKAMFSFTTPSTYLTDANIYMNYLSPSVIQPVTGSAISTWGSESKDAYLTVYICKGTTFNSSNCVELCTFTPTFKGGSAPSSYTSISLNCSTNVEPNTTYTIFIQDGSTYKLVSLKQSNGVSLNTATQQSTALRLGNVIVDFIDNEKPNRKLITAKEANYLTTTYPSDDLPMDYSKTLTFEEIGEFNLILKPNSQSYAFEQCVCIGDVQPSLSASFKPYINAHYRCESVSIDPDGSTNGSTTYFYTGGNHRITSSNSSIINGEYKFVAITDTSVGEMNDDPDEFYSLRGLSLILICPSNGPTSSVLEWNCLYPCDLLSIEYSIDSGECYGEESISVHKFVDTTDYGDLMDIGFLCNHGLESDNILNSSYNMSEDYIGKGIIIDIYDSNFESNFPSDGWVYSNFIQLKVKLRYDNGSIRTYTYNISLDLTSFG